jgi:hypothetical protein
LEVNVPAAAVNLPLLAPEGTVTDEGTVTIGVLLLSATLAPPVAVPLRFTVQTLELPGPSEVGVHPTLLIVNGAPATTIEPPVAVTLIPSPARDASSALVNPIVVVPAVADMVIETFATTPL